MFLNDHHFKNSRTIFLSQIKFSEMWEARNFFMIVLLIAGSLQCLQAQAPARYAIVIDEILADPLPAIGLPPYEYIELKNVSNDSLNLYHWKITDGSNIAIISINYWLQPDSFIVLCPSSAFNSLIAFGPTIGLSNFPSLNNEGDIISLVSPEGKLIHTVYYQLTWFNNAVKSEGGWTLEMVDTRNPCSGKSNWKASIDAKGGTPGKENSVGALNPDQIPPAFVRAYVKDSTTIVAVFDEPLDSNEAIIANHYILEDSQVSPFSAVALPPLFSEVELHFLNALSPGLIYQLVVSGIKDCSNNLVGQLNKRPVGLPSKADSMDLVINEILFNPRDDGADYVELYNKSKKIIDVTGIYVANRNTSGQIGTPRKISEIPYLIFPGDYLAISESKEKVQQQFTAKNPDLLLDLNMLPSFPDDKGVVVIMNSQGKTIDELIYAESWHFALAGNKEGIALERIDPSIRTQSRDNWTSASSTSGFGTPTYQNSQYKIGVNSPGGISIVPFLFSPDNDGVDDICFINYEMSEPNFVANVVIFDLNGREIRQLYQNATLSQKGYLRWDGLGGMGESLPSGVYIVYTEVFNLKGKTKRFKNVVTLARKF
jgi:lamin tail-like protein